MLAITLPQAPHVAITSSLSKPEFLNIDFRLVMLLSVITSVFEVYCNDWLFALYWDGMKAQHCHASFLIIFTLGVCPIRNSSTCALKRRITYAFCFVAAKKPQSNNNYTLNSSNAHIRAPYDPQSFKFMVKARIFIKISALIYVLNR